MTPQFVADVIGFMDNQAFELHDSMVISVTRRGEAVVLEVHLYVHTSAGRPGFDPGKGWSLEGELVIGAGVIEKRHAGDELWITRGWIETDGQRFDNMVPLPFNASGPVRLQFLGDTGELSIRGSSVDFKPSGALQFVEDSRW